MTAFRAPSISTILLFMMLLPACGGESTSQAGGENPAEPAALTLPLIDYSSKSAGELVGVIMEGETGLEAAAAVQEALRRAGVSIVDGEQILIAGEQPTSVNPATLEESLFLAMEARQRGSMFRLTVEELGQMLSDLGFPFREGANPGEEMLGFLQVWVQEAMANPQQTGSFVPLFIEAMTARDQRGLQLLGEGAAADQIGMGLLELELFAAEMTRHIDASGLEAQPSTHMPVLLGVAAAQILPAQKTSLCTPWYKSLFQGKLSGWDGVLEQAAPWINPINQISQSLNKALDAFDIQVDKALGVSAIGARLFKLAALRATMKIEVSLMGEQQVHRPLPSEAHTYYGFKARVGVDPALWKSFTDIVGEKGAESVRVARECMNALGIPMLTDPADLAAELPNFWVEWRIIEGKDYVNWSPDFQEGGGAPHQGYWRAPLAMADSTSGETRFKVQLNEVKKEAPGHKGDEMKAPVVVCALVDMTQPPSVGTFVSGAKGGLGLADSITELAGGMLMKLSKPYACNKPALQLVWHEGEAYLLKGTLTFEYDSTHDGIPHWDQMKQEIYFEVPVFLNESEFWMDFHILTSDFSREIVFRNAAWLMTSTHGGTAHGVYEEVWRDPMYGCSTRGNAEADVEIAMIRGEKVLSIYIIIRSLEPNTVQWCGASGYTQNEFNWCHLGENGFVDIPLPIKVGEKFNKEMQVAYNDGLQKCTWYLEFEPLPEDYGKATTQ